MRTAETDFTPFVLAAVLLLGLLVQALFHATPLPDAPITRQRVERAGALAIPAVADLPADSAILQYPLFSMAQPNGGATSDVAPPGSFSLLGLVKDGAQGSVVIRTGDAAIHAVKLGQEVLGWRLTAVGAGRATLLRGGVSQTLVLGAPPQATQPQATSPQIGPRLFLERAAMRRPLLLGLMLATAGCALPPARPVLTAFDERQPPAPQAAIPPTVDNTVGVSLAPGHAESPAPSIPRAPVNIRSGDISLDFPGVDVQAVAKVVLGDVLHVPYSVAPEVHTSITLQPGRRVAKSSVLPLFEQALSTAGLGLVVQPTGGYAILTVEQAKAAAPVNAGASFGFASEVVPLKFVNAEQLRRLIDPVLPGVVTGADVSAQTLTVAGTEGQRAAVRDLIRQFDVDWLRATSFALFVPRRTDSRILVPELDKVLNGEGAPTRDRVRLIAMDRLNGILAISTQPQYIDDVRRWVEILDREGENNTRRLFVYHVQNGRASDLAHTLAGAFGQSSAKPGTHEGGGGETTRGAGTNGAAQTTESSSGTSSNGLPSGVGSSPSGPSIGRSDASSNPTSFDRAGMEPTSTAGGGVSVEVNTGDFQARITNDEVNNAIVVYATPRNYAVIEDALRKLDVQPYQVVIEAAIAEVTLTDSLQFGVQGLFNNHGLSVGSTQNSTALTPTALLPGLNAIYAARTVTAALSALESLTKIKVISAPKLMVLNNQTASIEVGTQVPILTGSATSVISSGAPVVNSVDYRDTGIMLKVTPRVNSSGYVLLDLSQEVSDVIAAGSTSSINSPSFSTRRIATSVAVQDGEIIALGGLIRDNRTDTQGGLPGLSRVPVVGPLLFGNLNNADTRTELLVLMRPTVVRSVDDGRAVTEELREKLKGLRSLLGDAKAIP